MDSLGAFEARQCSPLVLAYIGDGVIELEVRRRIFAEGCTRVRELHRRTVRCVNAQNQARAYRALEPRMTPEERQVARRGRNASAARVRGHAGMIEYRMATGFEALAGYLYLQGDRERLGQLMDCLFEAVGEGC